MSKVDDTAIHSWYRTLTHLVNEAGTQQVVGHPIASFEEFRNYVVAVYNEGMVAGAEEAMRQWEARV